MALVSITIGSMEDVHTYDDTLIGESIVTNAPISAGPATLGSHLIRKDQGVGAADFPGSIDGTSNQIIVGDDGDGTVTLSTPQNIHTGANPLFANPRFLNLYLTGANITTSYSTPTDLVLTCGAAKTLKLTTSVWDDLRVPLDAAKLRGVSNPSFVKFAAVAGSVGVYVYAFNSATDQEIFFDVQLPHSYKQGTTIYPHVHWAPSSVGAGNVRWALEYTWANIGSTFGATTITYMTGATNTTYRRHNLTSFTGISGTGKNISSMLVCRLFRDANNAADTYGSNAYLLEFDFHFEIDTIGSRQAIVK